MSIANGIHPLRWYLCYHCWPGCLVLDPDPAAALVAGVWHIIGETACCRDKPGISVYSDGEIVVAVWQPDLELVSYLTVQVESQ